MTGLLPSPCGLHVPMGGAHLGRVALPVAFQALLPPNCGKGLPQVAAADSLPQGPLHQRPLRLQQQLHSVQRRRHRLSCTQSSPGHSRS